MTNGASTVAQGPTLAAAPGRPVEPSLFPALVETAPHPTAPQDGPVLRDGEGSVRANVARVFAAWSATADIIRTERGQVGLPPVPVHRMPDGAAKLSGIAARTATECRKWGVERVLDAVAWVGVDEEGAEWLRRNVKNLELLTVLRHVDEYAARWEAHRLAVREVYAAWEERRGVAPPPPPVEVAPVAAEPPARRRFRPVGGGARG